MDVHPVDSQEHFSESTMVHLNEDNRIRTDVHIYKNHVKTGQRYVFVRLGSPRRKQSEYFLLFIARRRHHSRLLITQLSDSNSFNKAPR